MQLHTDNISPALLVGTFRRFGALGPAYEILGVGNEDKQKGILLNVRVLDSGEELAYPYRQAVDDPEA